MQSKQIGKREMITLLRAAIAHEDAYIAASAGNDNPQVVEMANKARGRVGAFEAVLGAIERRERYQLRVYAVGHIGVSGV